jgi:phospholipid N-methyltransferase
MHQASSTTAASRREPLLLFARNFFKYPRMLGSLIPSSRYLIEHLLRQVDFRRARVIVEFGPGVGTITAEILRRMRSDATLVVFETNGEFVEFLRSSLADPRFHVVHGSAQEVGNVLKDLGCGPADYVISGIPFSTMPEELREDILHETHLAMRPDGAFLVFQFSSKVGPHLRRRFPHVHRDFEPRNILPAWVYYCAQRNGSPAPAGSRRRATRDR